MGVEHITLGTGDIYIWGQRMGYLANANLEIATEVQKLLAGVPKRTIVQVPVGTTMRLTAGIYQIEPNNIARSIGNQAATVLTSGAQTVADGANEEHTFRLDPTTGKQYIQLGPGPGMANAFTSVVLKNAPGESTTYVADTDYTLNATTGIVERISGGAIGSLATVRAAYGFTQIAGTRVDIGFEQAITDGLLQFVHTNPRSKKKIHAVMWKASPEGNFSLQFGDDFVAPDVAWEALEDSSKTQNSLGYLFWE